jgi:hypothetical protein
VANEKGIFEMIRINKNPYQRGKYGNAKVGVYHIIHKEKYQG